MQNLNNINRAISWKTKKVENGFMAIVTSFDYKVARVLHFEQTYKTRAIAKSNAQKAVRYLKSVQKENNHNDCIFNN